VCGQYIIYTYFLPLFDFVQSARRRLSVLLRFSSDDARIQSQGAREKINKCELRTL
jgi:hypothetical protein